jgi:hypothetical protein
MEIRCNISSVDFGISEAKHGLHVHTFGILNPSENDTISKFLLHKNIKIFFLLFIFLQDVDRLEVILIRLD